MTAGFTKEFSDTVPDWLRQAEAWAAHRQQIMTYEGEHGHFENSSDGFDSDDEAVNLVEVMIAILRPGRDTPGV